MNATLAPKTRLGRKAARTIAIMLAATSIGLGAGAQTAAAASFDPRIQSENSIECESSTYGLTPLVRIWQPWVLGTSSAWETIKWMPYLARWEPYKGWVMMFRAPDWYPSKVTNRGPHLDTFINQRQVMVFENLPRGYYYRIIHVVQWTSTSELGSMTSDYHTTRGGYCLLR